MKQNVEVMVSCMALLAMALAPQISPAANVKVHTGFLGSANDHFGYAVAMDYNTVVVGAPDEDDHEGTVYVFVRGNGGNNNWKVQDRLKAPGGLPGDQFGIDVDISGNLMIVGTSKALDPNLQSAPPGAAYVFVRYLIQGDPVWLYEQKLMPNDSQSFDYFGTAVAIDGNRAIIARAGEPRENISPAAYVFERDCHGECIFPWHQTWKVSRTEESFGWSVDLSGDTFVVGTPFDHSKVVDWNGGPHSISYYGPSSVYVYRLVNDVWWQDATLQPNDPLNWTFSTLSMLGWSVAIEGTNVVAGAPGPEAVGDSFYPSADDGAAYVYRRNGNIWNKVTKLTPSDASPPPGDFFNASDEFGSSVGISSNVIMVGSPLREVLHPDSNLLYIDQGSAYFFRYDGSWNEWAIASDPNGLGSDLFGYSAAINRGYCVAGIPFDDINHFYGTNLLFSAVNQGSAYLFAVPPYLVEIPNGGSVGVSP